MPGKLKPRTIGGMFGLEDMPHERSTYPPFLGRRNVLLANARSGIALLIEFLRPPAVWFPSYLCSVMSDVVDPRVTSIRYYEVNYDLVIGSAEWLNDVGKGDLTVFIDYFGFPFDRHFGEAARARGAWVLEDACQALLTEGVGEASDFTLFSPRKFLGVPDGGILVARSGVDLPHIELQRAPTEWLLTSIQAAILRREYDIHGGSRDWFPLFRRCDAEGPVGRYAMSELSQMLLLKGFDYGAIAERRRANYLTLLDRLGDLAIFTELPARVVPLGFPVRVGERDRIRQALFDQEIFPPVHWPVEGVVPETFRDSHRLDDDIMTLPCDQRYAPGDMERMARLVLAELE